MLTVANLVAYYIKSVLSGIQEKKLPVFFLLQLENATSN